MRMAGRGSLAVISVLVLFTAACGAEEVAEEPDGAAADEATEPTDERADESAEASDEASDEAVEEPVSEPEEVTAYVVGYHWGWAVFDEDGTELEMLEVPVGSEVELIAVNDHATQAIEQLPAPVAEAISSTSWHDRAHDDMERGHPDGLEDELDQAGMSLSEAIMVAHDGGVETEPTPDHELMVTGLGVDAFLDAHADEPERLVFTVEKEGNHEFRCLADCGVGHDYQRQEMLVVTA